jgi:hypothetical protein
VPACLRSQLVCTPLHALPCCTWNAGLRAEPLLQEWRTGVPDDQQRQAAQAAAAPARRPVGVGDGSASWCMKVLKRAQEQASEEVRAA